MSQTPIVFAGDPHGKFGGIIAHCQRLPCPGTLILVGDLDLTQPLIETLAPLYSSGWAIRWILGNHDTDTPRNYANLVSSLEPHINGNLGSRWAQIGGLIVGGLGGIFKERVWYPRVEMTPPVFASRRHYMRQVRVGERWHPASDGVDVPELKGMPLGARDSIFPEDIARLSGLRLDVVVSHECPQTRAMNGKGFAALDLLASGMTSCKLWVHGHHHRSYSERLTLPSGRQVMVRGLAIGECWDLELPA